MRNKVSSIVARVLAFVAYLKGRKSVVAGAVAVTMTPVLVGSSSAWATTTTDPLNGAGTNLVNKLVGNFTTYVIPAVVTVILAVYAFKMIVKLGTRFLNRA